MYNNLKGFLKASCLTQKEISSMLEMNIATFNFKVNGKSDFSITEGKKLSKILNRPMEEIFFTKEVSNEETKVS